MKTTIATLQLFCILFLLGCATKYNEPNPTKVIESTKKVRTTIQQAHENSKVVTEAIKKAQDASDEIDVVSQTLMDRIDEILGLLPQEFKPSMLIIKTDVTKLQTQEIILTSSLSTAYQTQNSQDTTLTQAKLFEAELEKHQLEYRQEAADLADTATKQSAKLAWYQRHWWGSWIVFGIGIIISIFFLLVKYTVKGGAIAAKIGI